MSALAIETSSARWLRAIKIVGVFVIVGPLVASLVLFALIVILGASDPKFAIPLAEVPRVWWSFCKISFMFGPPFVLLSGGTFALLSVFAFTSQIWIAIALALVPLPFLHLLPSVGEPIWQLSPLFFWSVVALAVVPTAICWALSRRWHGKMQ